MVLLAALLDALVDIVLPRCCVGCGGEFGPLCPGCTPDGPRAGDLAGVVAYAGYEGALRAALLAYKERGRRDLAGRLGELLGVAVQAAARAGRAPPGRIVLVPVPSARAAAAARGGDHVLRLGRRAAAHSGLRLAPDVLRLVRGVRDSSGLRSAERAANLHGAMVARHPPPGRFALVIDDIVTTGATLCEARRALEVAGWPVLGAAVIAQTRRRLPAAAQSHSPPIGSAQSFGLAW